MSYSDHRFPLAATTEFLVLLVSDLAASHYLQVINIDAQHLIILLQSLIFALHFRNSDHQSAKPVPQLNDVLDEAFFLKGRSDGGL